jgi:hypothetical protein
MQLYVCLYPQYSNTNTVHSCSRHGVVAAGSPRNGQVYLFQKHLFCWEYFIASVTVDRQKTLGSVLSASLLPSFLFTPALATSKWSGYYYT